MEWRQATPACRTGLRGKWWRHIQGGSGGGKYKGEVVVAKNVHGGRGRGKSKRVGGGVNDCRTQRWGGGWAAHFGSEEP